MGVTRNVHVKLSAETAAFTAAVERAREAADALREALRAVNETAVVVKVERERRTV